MLKKSVDRFLVIDFLRGIAVLLMIVYHFFFIFNFYNFFQINFDSWFWEILANVVRFVFLGLVGVSLYISRRHSGNFYYRQSKRALQILIYAMLITLVTYFAEKEQMVVFGILHHIVFAILILQFTANKPLFSLAFSLFAIIFGFLIKHIPTDESLIPYILGYNVDGYYALDYFPIFPWIALPALGIFIGSLLYKDRKINFDFALRFENSKIFSFIVSIGQNALLIYVGHLGVLTISAYLLRVLL